MRICEPEPAISTTSPIASTCADWPLPERARFLREVADFIEEFAQVRLLVHISDAPEAVFAEERLTKSG